MEDGKVEYAGFWVRLGATLIDTILIMLITFPLLVWIYGWEYFDPTLNTGMFAGPADFLITWVLPFIAVIWFWRARQATPGKMALSLHVVDADSGRTLSTGQSIGRYFAYIVSTLPLCIGFVWIAFDKRKQGWHDKLAGSVVVRTKNRGTEPVHLPEAQGDNAP
ncbi:MAG: RDD family protein [Gammaproteobacteria bacterium]|nr:RDD family protein [Gammaproteobacteria bacterium]MBU1414628.1 RDD family protein [Gammaproteobacteria bacterium]